VTDRAWDWRDELEALLRTRWSVDDLDQLLESLAQDPAVTDDEYLAAQAAINALAAGNGHPEQPVTAEALASVGVTVEQHQRFLDEDAGRADLTEAPSGDWDEALRQLFAKEDAAWTRAGDAAVWSADASEDAYDRVLDDPAVTVDPPRLWFDPSRAWSDPVDPARDELEDEAWVIDGRDRVFHALTGLDPAEHDTRELTGLVCSDWLEDFTPEEMREYYRRDDYAVNRLGTQHQPADQVGTQELVDQAVTSVETHDHPSGRAAEAGRDGDSEADPERARAEQLNHWRSDDEARTRGSSIEEDTDAAQDDL
jgi:hypothetical protein